MNYLALATDYDGTLAEDGVTSTATIAALRQWRASGRKLVLVTGRPLPELRQVFPHLGLFDRVVAENGGLLFDPATEAERVLGPEASAPFIARLRERGVDDMVAARAVIGTTVSHARVVRETIDEMGLPLDIILNTDALMILPRGTDKASGLAIALAELSLSAAQIVATGDAENDIVFLRACGYPVAVGNALPEVKAVARLVTTGQRGDGVAELIALILAGGQLPE